MDFDRFRARLYEFEALCDNEVKGNMVIERIRPEYADRWPVGTHPGLRIELLKLGLRSRMYKPYKHQAKAIELALQGNDVVLESPTASGKTLSYTVPMLDILLRTPDSHALMIYPMKALAFDQRDQISQLSAALSIKAESYDGDTLQDHRARIRRSPPNILITNPEFLNSSFMGHRDKWTAFLSNLRFLVIDEMHAYRGLFGSHMALSLRRFLLVLRRLGVSPQIFLSSATCANPVEHAKNLTGRDVKMVSAGNKLRPQRHYCFVKVETRDMFYSQALRRRIEKVAMLAALEGLHVLIFCPNKRFLENAYSSCLSEAPNQDVKCDAFAPYHADLLAQDRRKIQQKMKAGKINVVFSTNALELGIDIGGLDGVVLAGFPSSIMSAWQQIGRAGRNWKRDAFVLYFVMDDAIDRFYVSNINAFLNKPMEQLVANSHNEELIEKHLPSLASETFGRLRADDEEILGECLYRMARSSMGRFARTGTPQYDLSKILRGGIEKSFDLMYRGERLGKMPETRQYREAHKGAIFTFLGEKYRVETIKEDTIILQDCDPELSTYPKLCTTIHHEKEFNKSVNGDFGVVHGRLRVRLMLEGYTITRNERVKGEFISYSGPALDKDGLHAVWFNVPQDQLGFSGLAGLEHLFRVGTAFVIDAAYYDTSTYSELGITNISYFYETHRDGIGIARKLYEVWPQALMQGMEIAANCKCEKSCQNCIEPAKSWNSSDTEIDKHAGIALAQQLLATTL